MTALGTFAVVAVMLALGMIGLRARGDRTWINPLTAFGTAWLVVLLSYATSGPAALPLAPRTTAFVVVGAASFIAGCCFAPGRRLSGDAVPPRFDEARLSRWYWISVVATAGSVALQLAQTLPFLGAAGGLSGLFSGGGLSYRRAYLADRVASLSGGLGGGGLFTSLLGYVLFLGTVSVIFGAYYFTRGHIVRAVIPLLLLLAYSLLTLQRASFIYPLGVFLAAYVYQRRWAGMGGMGGGRTKRVVISVTVAAVLIVAVILPAALRSKASTGTDTQGGVVQYIESGLAGLNADILADRNDRQIAAAATGEGSPYPPIQPYAGPQPTSGHGVWTFQGLASILNRLGLPISTPPIQFSYLYTSANGTALSNTYSYVLYFFYDFGWPGVVILAFLFGLAATAMHRRVLSGSASALCIASILTTASAMSFFGLTPIRDFRYVLLMFVGMLVGRLVINPSTIRVRGHREPGSVVRHRGAARHVPVVGASAN